MRANIHPNWNPEAKVTCACGETFTTGSTVPSIRVEICSKCHPFYTGTQRLIDTAGKVERFKERRAKAAAAPAKTKEAPAKKQKREEKRIQ